jgi:hypothetical protein
MSRNIVELGKEQQAELQSIRLLQQEAVDPHALECLSQSGPQYFNPVLGDSDESTFKNLASLMGMIHDLLGREGGVTELEPGLRLVVQMAWAACQYEANRRSEGGVQ